MTGTPFDLLAFDQMILTGWKMGSIKSAFINTPGPFAFCTSITVIDFEESWFLSNMIGTGFLDVAFAQFTPFAQPFINLESNIIGSYSFSLLSGFLNPGQSFIAIDPNLKDFSRILITSSTLVGNLFDTAGGTNGTFTAVIDASHLNETINLVTDVGGVAQFNHAAVAGEVFVGQLVTISGYVNAENLVYNGTFIATFVAVGSFQVSSVPFGSNEAGGSFDADSVRLTDTATVLNDGETLVIDTDLATDYDGGAQVYNKTTNDFQINGVFTVTKTGSWDTAPINQKDPRVLGISNPGAADSNYICTGFVNDNSTVNGAIVNNRYTCTKSKWPWSVYES